MCWFSVASADAFRAGDQGTQVAEIQGELANLGYDVAADGDFGPATQEAVKEFQASAGISADGLVGPQTYQALMGRAMPQVSRGSNYYARRIIQTSLQYIGVPYVFGGTTPGGFDCSGFTRYVFANAGISLPRTADAQYELGTPVAYDDLIPGDLVFFSTYTYGASHVGVYMGDGKFIDASTSRGVTIDSLNSGYWSSTYIGARRVI
ncbi:C40 family peptidase [Pectinatus haikarae]